MHNMDRIMSEEFGQEYGFLNEGEYNPEHEYEGYEFGHEFSQEGEWEGEWEWEGEYEYEGEWEWEGEYEGEYEGELYSEEMEYELAAELLAVTNEQELEQFLGKLVSRVGRGISRFAKSGLGRKLIGGLKSVAKVALPIAGKAVGTFFGGPLGGMVGGKLASAATKLFEIQTEGMSNEDREFEVARRYVRFATSATRNTARNAKKGMPPKAAAVKGIKQAAAKHAPGLLSPAGTAGGGGASAGMGGSPFDGSPSGQSGTWTRQGSQIILSGV